MKPFTYLIIDLGCVLLPFIFSFVSYRSFYKEWKHFIPANLLVAFVFIVWDYYFTEIGVWGFNPEYLTGIYLGNLPLEEVLFFICIPYACVFGYFALTHFLPKTVRKIPVTQVIMAIIFLAIGITQYEKLYTSVTFIALAIYLFFSVAMRINQAQPLIGYACIIPFFLLANGLLTGSFLEAPIVWYNDAENLDIRLFTIPVEDAFYGMLLILMNVNLYEYFKRKFSA
ncbi:MAG: lycopene cyclase domain-containing protein [Flavobacteriales bacterium]